MRPIRGQHDHTRGRWRSDTGGSRAKDDAATPGLSIGDQVALIPGHIDTTVNLFDAYHAQRDDTVVSIWPITARGRSQ